MRKMDLADSLLSLGHLQRETRLSRSGPRPSQTQGSRFASFAERGAPFWCVATWSCCFSASRPVILPFGLLAITYLVYVCLLLFTPSIAHLLLYSSWSVLYWQKREHRVWQNALLVQKAHLSRPKAL